LDYKATKKLFIRKFLNISGSFEVLANYTKTNMKAIPYFERCLGNHEKLIESIRIKEPILS